VRFIRKEEDDILRKYQDKLKRNVDLEDSAELQDFSRSYKDFRQEKLNISSGLYERLCNLFEGLNVNVKDSKSVEDAIELSHLNITAKGAAGFAAFFVGLLALIFFSLGIAAYLTSEGVTLALIFIMFALISILLFNFIFKIPVYLSARYRMKASSQMVLCVLYIVIYMRHTSNLEHAIKFASEHIKGELALDFRKVFWDIETGKYSTIKESLDAYLLRWRETNLEFVESFHLIEGSLYETTNDRRIEMLEKALDIILDGTYENMLHYAQNLKNPITMLNMLGIVLPILGLVMLPLIGSLIEGAGFTKIIFLLVIYNVILPVSVAFIGLDILTKRPAGYSEINIVEENPEYKKYENIVVNINNKEVLINPAIFYVLIFIALLFLGLIPVIMHFFNVKDFFIMGDLLFLDYKSASGLACTSNSCYGPFGIGAVILSLFLPLAIAFSLWAYYSIRTKKLLVIREETQKLEFEFSAALFQLGNRVGDGVPVEVAVNDVANNFSGTSTGKFFEIVNNNINQQGMDIREAIFGERGAIKYYPSNLIKSSMEVLLESAKKGPKVVAKSMIGVSVYVNKIRQVNERLKDLLSEDISSMKGQISFLTPIIAGIVVGISSMIVSILGKLTSVLATQSSSASLTGGSEVTNYAGLVDLFKIENIVPSYYLQIVVGLYLVEIIIILSILSNGVENGDDKIKEKNSIGSNLLKGGILYLLVAGITTIIFGFLAISINLTG